MRVILVTGKGGVGKTTVAAATALRSADFGHRTLVMSTDPAHSLADAYQVPLGDSFSLFAESRWTELDDDLSGDFEGLGNLDLGGNTIAFGAGWRL